MSADALAHAEREQRAAAPPATLADAATELGMLGYASAWYLAELEERIAQAGLTIESVSLADLAATVKRDRLRWDICGTDRPPQRTLI